MQNISRDAHIPHANGMRAGAGGRLCRAPISKCRPHSSTHSLFLVLGVGYSPAAYDATLLQKEMLSRSYLSLSFAQRTRVKSFLLPGPKAQRLVSTAKKTEMEEGDDAASCKIFPHLGFHFQSERGREGETARVE